MLQNRVQTASPFSLHFRWPFAVSCLLHLAMVSAVIFLKPSSSFLQSTESVVTFILFENVGKTEAQKVVSKSAAPVSKNGRKQNSADETALKDSEPNSSKVGTEVSQLATAPSQTTGSLSASGSSAVKARPIDIYLSGLRQLIEQRKIYPAMAKRRGEVGRVLVTLEVLKDGTVQDVQVKEKSTYDRLNQAAFETVSKIKKYNPIPQAVAEASLRVEVPIEFSL